MLEWRGQNVDGERCLSATAIVIGTSHVADWRRNIQANSKMCVEKSVNQLRVQQ